MTAGFALRTYLLGDPAHFRYRNQVCWLVGSVLPSCPALTSPSRYPLSSSRIVKKQVDRFTTVDGAAHTAQPGCLKAIADATNGLAKLSASTASLWSDEVTAENVSTAACTTYHVAQ